VTAASAGGNGSLDVFWRSVANLTINVAGAPPSVVPNSGCFGGTDEWAVSQAAPMRRVDVNGAITFMPWCDSPEYSSGGFVADSVFSAGITMGSQQQFYMRDSVISPDAGMSGVWNQVFSGVTNAPATHFMQSGNPFTTVDTTPVAKERPYLYIDDTGAGNVFVPSAQTDTSGVSWQDGHTPGTSVPISDFYIADPTTDTAETMNAALASGLNLLLTPGVYRLDEALNVTNADTVVLGLGLATLTPTSGNAVITTADVGGIDIAGLTIDAGTVRSDVLVRIGSDPSVDLSNDPPALQDVFFRVGGDQAGKAGTALEVNSSSAVLDDLWIWRADHGVAGSVGWTVNTADNGLVVNGDDVTATGLFVEHFQKNNVVWNGEGGEVIFFQNELPYDPPDQASYMDGDSNGYAAFKVADDVTTFTGYGMGSYVYMRDNTDVRVANGFEAPFAPGVRFFDILTENLTGMGTIDHVINGFGGMADPKDPGMGVNVVNFSGLTTTRTITYQGAGAATPAPVTQRVNWAYMNDQPAYAQTDMEYFPASSGYDAVDTPVIDGYTADVATVPALAVLTAPATVSEAKPANAAGVVVTYTKVAASVTPAGPTVPTGGTVAGSASPLAGLLLLLTGVGLGVVVVRGRGYLG
jgi:hypothetical protein